ncbi:uncharacterized protein LOC144434473 [Glandiceps talaboti]
MAMLADGKRRNKWSSDPRNTLWANDSDKFGQRMLQKMGWKPGSGLGAKEHGITDHIRVTKNRDNIGLGANHKTEERWMAHQDEFESLLTDLNQHYGNSKTEDSKTQDDDSPSTTCTDLEQTSKKSKKRVHYMKFTRGKNLSLYSKKDLACIIGKKSNENTPSSSPKREESVSQQSSEEIAERSSPETDQSTSHGIVTVTSTQSLQDYFSAKMEKLKNKQGNFTPQQSREHSGAESDSSENRISFKVEKKDKKKKKKKSKKCDSLDDQVSNSVDVDRESHHDDDKKQENCEVTGKKQKSKKKKRLTHLIETQQEMIVDSKTDNKEEEKDVVEVVRKRKKSKKRKHCDDDDESKELEVVAMVTNTTDKEQVKKKKKQKITESSTDCTEVIPSKKSKKKKKKKQKDIE